MKKGFYLAGGLLILVGLLHIAALAIVPIETNAILPVVFALAIGIVYIVLGGLLLRLRDTYLLNSALIVLFGLLVDIGTLSAGEGQIAVVVTVLEAITLAVLAYLYLQGRTTLHRVR